jgi:hypothetical protein
MPNVYIFVFYAFSNVVVKEVLAYNATDGAASPIALISEDWILDSVASNALLDESEYSHGTHITPSPSALFIPLKGSRTKRERELSEEQVSLLMRLW